MDILSVTMLILGIIILTIPSLIQIIFYLISKNQQCGVISFEGNETNPSIRNKRILPFYGLLPFKYENKWYWGRFVIIVEVKTNDNKWLPVVTKLENKQNIW